MNILVPHTVQFSFLQWASPGASIRNVGILVYVPTTEALHWRFVDDWTSVTNDPEDQEYLALLSTDLISSAADMGAGRFLDHLEDTLSGVLRITDRSSVSVNDVNEADSVLESMFLQEIASQAPIKAHVVGYGSQHG